VFVGASRFGGRKMQLEVGDPDVVECRREFGLGLGHGGQLEVSRKEM
jgi:hypothetical protein